MQTITKATKGPILTGCVDLTLSDGDTNVVTRSEIELLIKAGEGLTIEFKASFPKNATEIAQDIAAFSNTEGGTVLVGVDDQGNALGVINSDETMQRIVGAASSICKPPMRPAMGRTILEDDRQVVWVTIPKNRESLTLVNGKCYVRNGPVAVPVEDSTELQKLHARKGKRWYRTSLLIIGLVLSVISAMLFAGHRMFNGRSSNPGNRVAEAKKAFSLAITYEAQGDDEQAISTLKDAISRDPGFGEAYLRAAYISQQDDWYDQAGDFVRQAEQSQAMQDPNFARQVEAMKLYLNENDEAAIEEFKLLADIEPTNTYVLYYYGDLALEMGRFAEAETALANCLAISPLDPLCNFDTMMLRVSQNRFDDALGIYERLTKRSVDYPWFDIPVGLALLGKDDVDGATKKLTQFAETAKRFHGSLLFTTAQEYQIDLLTYQGRIEEARVLTKEVSTLEKPESRASPLLAMAMVDAILGDKKHAEDDLGLAREISSSDSDFSSAEKILAIIAFEIKARPMAHASSGVSSAESKLGPLDSEFVAAMKDLRDLRFEDAIRRLKFIHEKDDDPLYTFFLGRAYMMKGDWQRAIESMEAVQNGKGRLLAQGDLPVAAWPLSFYFIGNCREELGHHDKAAFSYQKFLDLWRAADPDITQVGDARKKLSRLSL